MKGLKNYLPNLASDTSGACSALFESGGLIVIHDAAGCMENYLCYEEPRMFGSSSLIFSSGLGHLEAAMGDDGILLEKLWSSSRELEPEFIAIIGSPVPYTIGTDLEGIASEAEAETGIPSFAVSCGGFSDYSSGAAEAMKKLIHRLAIPSSERRGEFTVNLLGATPLDFSLSELAYIKNMLEKHGNMKIKTPFMGTSAKDAANADANLVISASGFAAARYMKERFNIPYVCGLPIKEDQAKSIAAALRGKDVEPINISGKPEILVIGESVFAASLARAIFLETGKSAAIATVGMNDDELLDGAAHIKAKNEEVISAELARGYFLAVGDPLYRALLPERSECAFIDRPHSALSSHLFLKPESGFEDIISKIKEKVQ